MPRIQAAYYGDLGAVMVAVRSGGDVNEEDPRDGSRPIHGAGLSGAADVAAWLIRMNADVHPADAKGKTALHYACRGDAAMLVKTLLQANADPNALDLDGKPASSFATDEEVAAVLANPEFELAEEREAKAALAASPAKDPGERPPHEREAEREAIARGEAARAAAA